MANESLFGLMVAAMPKRVSPDLPGWRLREREFADSIYVKSKSQNSLSRSARNCRATLSDGKDAVVSATVVCTTLPRRF